MTPTTPSTPPAESPAAVVRRYAAVLDARDWSGLRALLAPTFSSVLLHTGETFDAEGYVAFNADYPGQWRVTVEDVVAQEHRVALRARVTDGTVVHHLACFAEVRGGVLASLEEIWSEAVAPPPERSRT